MTPRELYLAAQAYNENKAQEIEETQQKIFLLASLNRAMIWGKKAPTYESVFNRKHEMTDEQMYLAVVAMNAALGGNDNRKKG